MTKRWIPFRLMPASWGLIGNKYTEAEAYYNLAGEALDRRLAVIHNDDEADLAFANLILDHKHKKINDYTYETRCNELDNLGDPKTRSKIQLKIDHKYKMFDDHQYDIRLNEIDNEGDPKALADGRLDIDVRHNLITPYEAAHQKLENKHPGKGLDYELAVLVLDHEHGKLNRNQYEKSTATLKNQPWVAFVDSGFDPEQGIDGVFFELDWNIQWVDFLKLHGFVGHSDEQIVEDWFSEVCRSYSQPNAPQTLLPPIDSTYPMGFDSEE